VWQYEDLDAPGSVVYQEVALGETVLVNGKSYMRIWSGSASDYVRQVDTRVYYWSPLPYDSLGWEKLWYDFSKGPGDTVSAVVVNGDTVDFVIVLAAGRGSFWGRELAWWTFTGNFGKIAVSDSIGVTYVLYEGGYEIRLRGAIIDGTTYGTVTSVQAIPTDLPQGPGISMTSFPNPFNQSTTIVFFNPAEQVARVEVTNILGQSIRVLADSPFTTGHHRLHWDGKDHAGRLVPSGLYLCMYASRSGRAHTMLMVVR
jgi:hypothetical protein